MGAPKDPDDLAEARALFLARWGELGPQWGVSRTTSQVHALLLVSPAPLTTDDVMDALAVSRGGAHTSLQELVAWGLVERRRAPGSRRDHYEAEKDVFRVLQRIVRERKRKELEPVLDTLETCLDLARKTPGPEARAFRRQLTDLRRLTLLADRAMEKLGSLRTATLLRWVTRFLR